LDSLDKSIIRFQGGAHSVVKALAKEVGKKGIFGQCRLRRGLLKQT